MPDATAIHDHGLPNDTTGNPVNTPTLPGDDARRNQLLAALPDADWVRWQSQLECVQLQSGRVLCESGRMPEYAYFPTTAVVSLMHMTCDGSSAEVAVVGNDGVVGIALFLGGNAMPSQAVVQAAGRAYRLPARAMRHEIDRAGPVPGLLLRYIHALIAQVAQTAACNRHHSIDQQVCRRLLQGLDRSTSDELMMTHEHVAHLLGVRREGVSAAAQKLRRAGAISYKRGHIAVLDRNRLELDSCECYAANRKHFAHSQPMAMAA
jgi:CRP-like cAMP-binding protein